MNLLEPIRRQARTYPDRTALIDGGNKVSYGKLWAQVGAVAAQLRNEGIARGQCVAISGLPTQPRLILMLALARIGASSIGIHGHMHPSVRDPLFAKSKAVAWVIREAPAEPGVSPRQIAPTDLFREGRIAPPVLATDVDDEVWRISLSSGTTGSFKCIAWTHAQRAGLQKFSADSNPAGPRERLLLAVDLNVSFATSNVLQQLSAGGAVVIPRSIAPDAIAESLARDRPTRLLSAPAIASSLVGHLEKNPPAAPFRSLLSLMLGGSVVTPKLRADLEKLCPQVMVIYGSTELGPVARADQALFLENPQTAGRLLPWVEAQAIGDDGNPLPAGEAGRLRFRTPSMPSGYLGDEEATASAFRDGWFLPGDKGAIDGNRLLMLGGRIDDVLNLQGLKVDPAPIEAALASHPDVRDAAVTPCVGEDGKSILAMLVVLARPGATPDAQSLVAHVVAEIGELHTRAMVVPVEALPRTSAGKLARGRLQALVAAHVESQQSPPDAS